MFSYESILSDISEKDHLGIDLSYEPEFELIEDEIKKSTSLFATSKTDWPLVHDNSLNLLEKKSKDYRLVYWLCLSMTKKEIAFNESELVLIINKFIIKYTDRIYPKRKRSLYSSINQLISLLSEYIKSKVDTLINADDITILITHLSTLNDTLSSVFNDNTDNFSLVISIIKKQKQRLVSEKENTPIAKPEPTLPTPKSVSDTATSPSYFQDEITHDREANKAFRHMQEITRKLSKYWLTTHLGDDKAYQLNRTLTWLTISQRPASNDQNITMLKPVPAVRKQYFERLKSESNHTTLLIELEESLSKSPFWIDGHFMVWESLMALNHLDAAQSVINQLTLLVQKTPDILELKFDDGTPFADDSTQSWVQQQSLPSTHTPTASFNTVVEPLTHCPWDEALQEAITQLPQHSLSDVMAPLITGHHQARSNREAFFWQFNQAKLLLQSAHYDLANSLFSWLDKHYSQSVLTHWDPILEERLLELWLQCHSQLPKKDQDSQLLTHLRERLCCLNPIRVLN